MDTLAAERLDKLGQLVVVIAGFFATMQLLLVTAAGGSVPPARVLLTVAVTVACAVRYWWVILLLPWPFRVVRLALLLAAWSTLPVVALAMPDPQRWVLALAALSTIGCLTEVYNGLTKQWRIGSEATSRSLRRDHVAGAAAAAAAAAILVSAGLMLRPVALDRLVLVMVVADWSRLATMIRRHQRFPSTEGSA
jgi:hypothetical protein